jgi:DNA repair protein RecO (recombination protein O)
VFWAPRRSLAAHYAGLYMADVVSQLITDHDPHPRTYDALVRGLRRLDRPEDRLGATLRLQWTALVDAGYEPELRRDARTGEALPGYRTLAFDPGAGGLIADPGPGTRDAWRVRAQTVERLRALRDEPDTDDASVAANGADGRGCRLLDAWIARIVGAPIRSREAFFQVFSPN